MAEEKLTQKATAVLQDAQQSAAMNYHQEVTSRHVFHALLKDRDPIIDHILAQTKIEPSLLENKAAQLVKNQPFQKACGLITPMARPMLPRWPGMRLIRNSWPKKEKLS